MRAVRSALGACVLWWPAALAFGAQSAGAAPEPARFEISVGYLGRNGEMTSGDDYVAASDYSTVCGWLFGWFCWSVPTNQQLYENGGYQVTYEASPRVSARLFFLKYGWVGLSLEQVRGTLSANLDSSPSFDPATSRHALGAIGGERVAVSIGARWTWQEYPSVPVDFYGGLSWDVVGERFMPEAPICVSATACGQYRVRATSSGGAGLLIGTAVPMTRSLYLAAELTLHSKEWDFAYEWTGEGTDELRDQEDHIDQSDTVYSLALNYRL